MIICITNFFNVICFLMLLYNFTGGMYKSVLEAEDIKANALGIFLKGQRSWKSSPLEETVADRFKQTLEVSKGNK